MQIEILDDADQLGYSAATAGAELIREAIILRDEANIILATGASQFAMLATLVKEPGIAWEKVRCFHLDEYVGMSTSHPASFCRYLKERFTDQLPQPPRSFTFIDGENDPREECRRLGELISPHSIDVAFIGIGENAHLAFNDPPADFETVAPYHVVNLDEACRRQQLGEGWFDSLDEVPKQAISMSIHWILQSTAIICSVPDQRKAEAVQNAVNGAITPDCPASILQEHTGTTLYLDQASASLLGQQSTEF